MKRSKNTLFFKKSSMKNNIEWFLIRVKRWNIDGDKNQNGGKMGTRYIKYIKTAMKENKIEKNENEREKYEYF